MNVQGMRNACFMHRCLKGLHDLTAGDSVKGNYVVERKAAHVVLERSDAAGVDDFDPDAPRRVKDPGDVIADRRRALSRADETENEIVVSENCQDGFVDNRSVCEFKMRVQRVVRRYCGLDHSREAHLGVEAACLEGRPTGIGKRRDSRTAGVSPVMLGQ